MCRNFLVALIALAVPFAHAGEPTRPLRYALPKAKAVKLLAVWGNPEPQEPGYEHGSAMTPDGRFAIYASNGALLIPGDAEKAVLELWDVTAGKMLAEFRLPGNVVRALALSHDGKRALTDMLKKGSRLVLWDLRNGNMISEFGGDYDDEDDAISDLRFHPDGTQAFSLHGGGILRHWDLQLKKAVRFAQAKQEIAVGLAFHPDRSQALTGAGTKMVLWDMTRKKPIRTIDAHEDQVVSLAFSEDGRRAISAGADGSVKLWDIEKGIRLGQATKGPAGKTRLSISFAGDSRKVLCVRTGFDAETGTRLDCEVSLWDGEANKTLWSHKSHFKGTVPIAVVEGGRAAILGGGDNFFSRWNLVEGREEKIWGPHKGPVTTLVVGSDGAVYSGSQDGTIKAWVKSLDMRTLTGHADAVNAIALSKDCQFLVSGSADKTVKLWDTAKGRLIKTFAGHTSSITAVAISPDFQWLVSSSNDRTVKIWDIVTGKERQNLEGHAEGVNGVAFSPDAGWIASAGDDNTIRLWPIKDGKSDPNRDLVVLEGHKRQVMCLAFSTDGATLVSGSQDKTVKVWDARQGKVLRTIEGHKNWVSGITILEGDKLAASTSDDFTVRIWELASGNEVGQIDLASNSDCPRCVAAKDGRNFVVGTSGWVILRCQLEGTK